MGPVGKVVRVTGDRYWVRSGATIAATRPQPFERIALTWENAFGGWDRSHADPARHTFEPRNPVGTSFRAPGGVFEDRIHLPNLEDPTQRIERRAQARKERR